MGGRFTRGSSRTQLSAAQRRTVWDAFITLAKTQGAVVVAGDRLAKDDQVLFAGQLVRTRQVPFPLDFHTAGIAAQALLNVAGAFVTAGRPDDRDALCDLMIEAARCCERLLSLDAQRTIDRMQGEARHDPDGGRP